MRMHQKSLIKLIGEICGPCPESGAEIGVYRGETSALLRSSFPACRMLFVDAWREWEEGAEYRRDTMGKLTQLEWDSVKHEAVLKISATVGAPYSILQDTSARAACTQPNDSLDFVFIDADHSYEAVKNDIFLWLPKVTRLICGHDYHGKGSWKGVTRAVNEIFGESDVISRRGLIWAYKIR